MGTCMSWSCEITLAARPISASRARGFVRDRLAEHALSHLSSDVELVVSELSTNAVVHTASSFTVLLHAFEDTLLLEVRDGSRVGPTLVAAQVHDTGGRGMALVDVLCRDWGVDAHADGGKSVWVTFSLGARPVA